MLKEWNIEYFPTEFLQTALKLIQTSCINNKRILHEYVFDILYYYIRQSFKSQKS